MTNGLVAKTAPRPSEEAAVQPSASLVYLRGGLLMIDSLQIAHVFGRSHDDVLQPLDTLIQGGRFNHVDFKTVERPDQKGEARRIIELTERGAWIAALVIGACCAVELQILRVDAVMTMREMLRQDTRAADDARRAASVATFIMNDAIKAAREKQGKSTTAGQYMSEAKLVGYVVFGRYAGVDSEGLSLSDFRMLELVRLFNATLIESGKDYQERKVILLEFVRCLNLNHVKVRDSWSGLLIGIELAPGSV